MGRAYTGGVRSWETPKSQMSLVKVFNANLVDFRRPSVRDTKIKRHTRTVWGMRQVRRLLWYSQDLAAALNMKTLRAEQGLGENHIEMNISSDVESTRPGQKKCPLGGPWESSRMKNGQRLQISSKLLNKLRGFAASADSSVVTRPTNIRNPKRVSEV